jgi:hypothetical protein
MKFRLARWVFGLSTGMFLLGSMAAAAQAANTVSGEAFGVSANVGIVVIPKTPHVVLPPGGGMVESEVLSVSVPGTVRSDTLRVTTSGAIGAGTASAQSSATVEAVDIAGGLVTAKLVVAMASSTANGATATSNAEGSTLIGLTVNGLSLGDVSPPPNTTIDVPGVGRVILNEQLSGGDGVHTTALTVNMIHVVLTGAVAGDIIVASAHSDVNFTPAPTPVPTPVTGFMTGGGRLGTGRTIATFGLNARPNLQGHLQYIDHAQGLKVHSTGLTDYASLGGTCVTFSGTARVNNTDGFHFTVRQACDNGEPGVGRDTFEISVEELSYSSRYLGTVLTGGNLQLH